MKIGIDISQIVYKGTGVGRFTEGLTNAILDYDTQHEWVFFFSSLRGTLDTSIVEKIQQKKFILKKMALPPVLLSFVWNNLHVYSIDSTIGKLDWLITSDWTEPPSKIKKATIIHDLAYLRIPETVDKKIIKVQKKRIHWVKKESSLIFTDSLSTQKDVNELLNIPEEKTYTIYPGVNIKNPSEDDKENTKSKYTLTKPFILAVGKVEPRKNLKRLVEAFNELNRTDIELLIAGPPGWDDISSQQNNIRFLGYVSDEELASLYNLAVCFIYPSLFEGFGYPPIEAMKLGAPVALSNTSSLKEIGENAALLFDPLNIDDIKNSIQTLIDNAEVRESLKQKGLEKSNIYTWEHYYNEMIKKLENF